MYSPIDLAGLSRIRRLVACLASGPLAWFTRMLWRRAPARRCTFPTGRLADRIWRWNRRISLLPRKQAAGRLVRFPGGMRMELDLSRLTDSLAYCYGLGESEVGLLYRQIVRRGDTVLDVGGNIGTAAIDFAFAEPEATIHVFEPSPEMLAALQRNIDLNRLANVEAHPFGLGARDTRGWLQGDMAGNPGSNYVAENARGGIAQVELRRLDGLPFIRDVSLIKIDVEGSELSVLQGGAECLARSRPLIIVERNDQALARAGVTWEEVEALLQGWGYLLGFLEFGILSSYRSDEAKSRGLHNVIALHYANPRHWEFVASEQRV